MNNLQLEKILNSKLSPELIKDYAPNGLQVEGCPQIKRVVTGVTASQALIDKAIE
ncbi:Nif3-like dinuclear metal center hexameric protein, partial [Vibrio sp. Vb1026]